MKYCYNCGAQVEDDFTFCRSCGADLKNSNDGEIQFEGQGYVPPQTKPTKSNKSRVAAALLCFFLGGLGIHRFYAGKIGTAIILLCCTLLGFILIFPLFITGIWTLIDFIIIICGGFKDGEGLSI